MDCDDELHTLIGNRAGRMSVWVWFKADDSELPYEMHGIIPVDIFLILFFVGVSAYNYYSWSVFVRRHDIWHSPHMICMVGMLLQLVGISLDLVYHIIYKVEGDDHQIMWVLSNVLLVMGETAMILLLYMLANGWMTVWTKYEWEDGLETCLPTFAIIILVNIIFVGLSMIERDAYHKFHDFSGWVGLAMIFFKMVLVGLYFYLRIQNEHKVKKKQKMFYDTIFYIGLIFILSDPMLILSMFILPDWNRYFYYYFFDQLIHIGLQMYMLVQMSQRNSHFQVGVGDFTGLPGNMKDH